MESIKEEYTNLMASYLSLKAEDLSENERLLIDRSFELFNDKLTLIKTLEDEINRLAIELANLKAMTETDYRNDEPTYNNPNED